MVDYSLFGPVLVGILLWRRTSTLRCRAAEPTVSQLLQRSLAQRHVAIPELASVILLRLARFKRSLMLEAFRLLILFDDARLGSLRKQTTSVNDLAFLMNSTNQLSGGSRVGTRWIWVFVESEIDRGNASVVCLKRLVAAGGNALLDDGSGFY